MKGTKCVHCEQDDDDANTKTCKKGCSEIKLFGVQISVPDDDGAAGSSSIRKCRSMDNLEACISENAAAAAEEPSGYLSDGFVHQHSKSHERKRGQPWSEEEHRSFLEGLKKLGKGDWKGIATKFVPSRKPSQVASHAQKYFNRLNLTPSNKKRRRASVFDVPLTHNANQQSQGSQSNNNADKGFHIANSSAAASKNISEHKVLPHVTTSERPPLAPMQPYSWLPNIPGLIYLQPRVAGFTKGYPSQAVMARIPWPQVVYLPSESASFVSNNLSTSRRRWFEAGPSPSTTTNNEELNLNIRNLTL